MKKSILLSLIILLVAGLWLASGYLPQGESDTQPQMIEGQTDGDAMIRVTVQDLEAENYVRTIRVTGVSQASRKVDIKSEEEGRIVALAVEKGSIVAVDAPLARIEMLDRDARLGEAETLLKQREIEFKAAQSLQKRGFNSQVRLAESEAALETARANLETAKIALEKLIMTAPFAGVISEQFIEIGDYVRHGDMAYTILQLNPLEIRAFVNEQDVLYLQEGGSAAIAFLNGQRKVGTITHISPSADPQTRTFAVEVSMPNEGGQFPDGLTARLHIPLETVSAYQISPALLILADDGTVGVRVLDKDNKVHFQPIIIYADETEGMWVGGLPDSVRLITVGHQFVTDNQLVEPVLADPVKE